jgi:asparagine synthase (glutamine-hydrolysing)
VSGIAGTLLLEADRALEPSDLDAMARGLGGEGDPRRAVLDAGRLALVVRGFHGYASGLVTRQTGDATCAIAFHGLFLGAADRGGAGGDDRLGDALLERFLERGVSAVDDLRGEFVIAFWDGRDRALHLVTDRFRVQSLLMARTNGALLFASRMRALLAAPVPLHPTVDATGVLDVVGGSMISTPRTIFKEVMKVEPGHVLTCRDGRVESRAYWDVDFTRLDGSPIERLREDTRRALAGAVADRLALDGGGERVGAFLSGGVDSSCVTGLIARNQRTPVRTFSIGFSEARFNELSYARIAAGAFGAKHVEYLVTPSDALATLPRVVDAFDEPFANASAVPTYWCAHVAREHGIDAMYAGDGGDELWAGNERYAADRVFAHYDRVPAPLRRWLITPGFRALAAVAPIPLFVKAGKYVTRASLPPARRLSSYGFWYIVPPSDMVEPDFLRQAGDYVPFGMSNWHYEHARARTDLDRQLYLDLKVTIGDNDIFKVTRMCEEAGVAVRFPFLDERVADMAERVPARLKMRGNELRTFFKETYADLLPPEVRAKTKHGFGLPIAIWLKTDPALNETMRDLVLGSRSLGRGYFKKPMLEELVRLHESDTTTFYGMILWNLMILELWHRRVLDAPRD